MRDTFMKVAQSMMVKKQLVADKRLKDKMILSVMPPKVASWLMTGQYEDTDEGNSMFPVSSAVQSSAGEDIDEVNKKQKNGIEDDLSSQDSISSSSIKMDFQRTGFDNRRPGFGARRKTPKAILACWKNS